MRTLSEILSMRERVDALSIYNGEWIAKVQLAEVKNTCDLLVLFNDFFDEKYNHKIWDDEIVRHPLLIEYASNFSITNVDEVDRMFNHLMSLLDILMLGREIDDFVVWQQHREAQMEKTEDKWKKSQTFVKESMAFMLDGKPWGLDMFKHYSAEEGSLIREMGDGAYLKPEWFAKRGAKTKTGWMLKALCELIPVEYPNKFAFIAKLSTELGNTAMTRQLANSLSKSGHT